MKNYPYIILDKEGNGSFHGPDAHEYVNDPLRKRLWDIFNSHGDNRFFVLDGETVIAAQTTEDGAIGYMKPGYVLLQLRV